MDPEDMDEKYLASYSRQIFEAIDETDPKAIWILQNWFMVHSGPVWTLPRVKAFLSGIPIVSNFVPFSSRFWRSFQKKSVGVEIGTSVIVICGHVCVAHVRHLPHNAVHMRPTLLSGSPLVQHLF